MLLCEGIYANGFLNKLIIVLMGETSFDLLFSVQYFKKFNKVTSLYRRYKLATLKCMTNMMSVIHSNTSKIITEASHLFL